MQRPRCDLCGAEYGTFYTEHFEQHVSPPRILGFVCSSCHTKIHLPTKASVLKRRVESGERIYTGFATPDGKPVYLCTQSTKRGWRLTKSKSGPWGAGEDCPRVVHGWLFSPKAIAGCLGPDPCTFLREAR